MARKRLNEPVSEQLDLIDTKDPKWKAAAKQIAEYEGQKSENAAQHSANLEALDRKKKKVLEAVQEAGSKPDAEGTYHFPMGDGTTYDISQPAQLKIKRRKVAVETGLDAAVAEEEEGA